MMQMQMDHHHHRRTLFFQPFNSSTETTTTPLKNNSAVFSRNYYNYNFKQRHQPTSSAFDSSLALTILILLTALLSMGFLSLYLRRFSDTQNSSSTTTTTSSRRRRPDFVPPVSSAVYDDDDNQKGKGLDPSTVRSLPMVCYGEDVIIFSDCPICLAEFEQAEILKIIPYCRHVFHPMCIDTWLSSHMSCPFCRSTRFCREMDDNDGGDEIRLVVEQKHDNNGVEESNQVIDQRS